MNNLRWDELGREDRAKECNALPDPTDYGAGHTIHELIISLFGARKSLRCKQDEKTSKGV